MNRRFSAFLATSIVAGALATPTFVTAAPHSVAISLSCIEQDPTKLTRLCTADSHFDDSAKTTLWWSGENVTLANAGPLSVIATCTSFGTPAFVSVADGLGTVIGASAKVLIPCDISAH